MTTGTAMLPVAEALFTAEQYAAHPDYGRPTELVDGMVVETHSPGMLRGYITANIVGLLRTFVRAHGLGRVFGNVAGIITRRNPDNVRGPDAAFFSYGRLPRGPLSEGFPHVTPELVFEIKSPTDRWVTTTTRAAEYLNAGVLCVCVIDTKTGSVAVYRENELPRLHSFEDDLTLADVLPGCAIPIRQFFE